VIDDNGVEHALSPSKQVEYDVKGSFGNSGVQQDTILANQLDQQLAHLLYKVGTKTIHLRLTGDGRDSGPYEADADLDIQPEAVDANWWAWIGLFDSNQTNFVGWNRDYPRTFAAQWLSASCTARPIIQQRPLEDAEHCYAI